MSQSYSEFNRSEKSALLSKKKVRESYNCIIPKSTWANIVTKNCLLYQLKICLKGQAMLAQADDSFFHASIYSVFEVKMILLLVPNTVFLALFWTWLI